LHRTHHPGRHRRPERSLRHESIWSFHTGYQHDRGNPPPDPQAIKTRGAFPDEPSATKLVYLALMRAKHKWRKADNWTSALPALKIHFGDRIPDQQTRK
jgi:hypothetical protein